MDGVSHTVEAGWPVVKPNVASLKPSASAISLKCKVISPSQFAVSGVTAP
jgi:hypothetical protein